MQKKSEFLKQPNKFWDKIIYFFKTYNHEILKYLTLIITVPSAIFVLCEWIEISGEIQSITVGNDTFSFMTLPDWIVQIGMTQFTESTNQTYAIALIVLVGALKLMCLFSTELALFGIWKSIVREKKSSCLKSSQIIAVVLNVFAVTIIIVANIFIERLISTKYANLRPTLWMYLSFSFSVVSLILQKFYNKSLKNKSKKSN